MKLDPRVLKHISAEMLAQLTQAKDNFFISSSEKIEHREAIHELVNIVQKDKAMGSRMQKEAVTLQVQLLTGEIGTEELYKTLLASTVSGMVLGACLAMTWPSSALENNAEQRIN